MNNLFKYIVAAFVLIIMGAIIVVQFLPKPKLSFTERQNINLAIQKLNSELPQEIGTIGKIKMPGIGCLNRYRAFVRLFRAV